MQLGMIGLGRMGANIVRRLMRNGHTCVVYDTHPDAVADLVKEGAVGAASLEEFAAKLEKPRAAWIMVPAAVTDKVIQGLVPHLEKGDILIDGGNSYFRDDRRRAAALAPQGIRYLDCGTSGGVWGLERGYCLMIGGETDAVTHLDPIFKTIAPGRGDLGREAGALSKPVRRRWRRVLRDLDRRRRWRRERIGQYGFGAGGACCAGVAGVAGARRAQPAIF
jgi:6-phosphogluconate dehydrogenase